MDSVQQQSPRFFQWRWSVFLSMFCGWSCYNLIRYNFLSTINSLILHQGFSRSDVGMISSCFSMSYGVSKFLASVISDHTSSHVLFSRGLILAGTCSLAFPLAHTVALACVVWLLEGVTQGCGWPPCVILLKAWYPPSQIGRWWSILGSAGNLISAILPLVIIFMTSIFHWSMSYYVFGVFAIAVGVLVNFTIKDTPGDIARKGSGAVTKDQAHKKSDGDKEGVIRRWYTVFFIPDLLVVSAIYAILYFMHGSCTFWSQLFLVQEAGMSETQAAACFSMYQVGAVIGNIGAGSISDVFVTPITSKCSCPRAPFLLGVSILMVIFLHLFRTAVGVNSHEGWVSLLMFTLGCIVTSGVAVIGLSAMEVVPKHLVGGAHGLACAVAQGGSFSAGWPFTLVVERHGWRAAYGVVEWSLLVMVAASSYMAFRLIRTHKKLKTS